MANKSVKRRLDRDFLTVQGTAATSSAVPASPAKPATPKAKQRKVKAAGAALVKLSPKMKEFAKALGSPNKVQQRSEARGAVAKRELAHLRALAIPALELPSESFDKRILVL